MNKYSCIIDKECASDLWFGWLSELDEDGSVTDELITKRCHTKKEAVDRLRTMAHRQGYEWAGDAIDEAESTK